jgi:hypothetical protein
MCLWPVNQTDAASPVLVLTPSRTLSPPRVSRYVTRIACRMAALSSGSKKLLYARTILLSTALSLRLSGRHRRMGTGAHTCESKAFTGNIASAVFQPAFHNPTCEWWCSLPIPDIALARDSERATRLFGVLEPPGLLSRSHAPARPKIARSKFGFIHWPGWSRFVRAWTVGDVR